MAGQQAAKARFESGLRTEKLREQEMRRRAAALGPVPIHVHFPDGLILQVMPLPDSPVGVCAPFFWQLQGWNDWASICIFNGMVQSW